MEPCGTPVEIGTRFDIQLSTLHIVYDLLNTNRKHFSYLPFYTIGACQIYTLYN